MRIFRWIAVAFSMYSRIPMPSFEWKEDDMSGGLMFLPIVGAVIGAASVGVYFLADAYAISAIPLILILGLLPIAITGGFHIDGYMDTTDALRSYQPMEKKLEILKDPHIGAFAVIGVIKVMLTYGIGLSLLTDYWNLNTAISYGLIFVVSRCVCGISSIVLPKAKKDGMLSEETKARNKSGCIVLLVQLFLALGVLLGIEPVKGLLIVAGLIVVTLYYVQITKKQFGGVTGDTAGYFVTVSENIMVVVLGIAAWCGL